jgi:DNA-binding response OmpR family regulator
LDKYRPKKRPTVYKEKYSGFDRSVDVYVSRIRHQLGDDAENPNYLKTVRGVGYLFVDHEGNAR